MDEIQRLRAIIKSMPHLRPASSPDAQINARAKINLTLRVLGRRPDGYHEIESIVAFADIGDRVSRGRRREDAMPRPAALCVSGPFAGAIAGENLVETAIRLVEEVVGAPLDDDFVLEKNLPVAAGIGGGSADAAAVLKLIGDCSDDLRILIGARGIARRLGADVPVCMLGLPALMTGTGECLKPLALPLLDLVLANACEPVPADKTRRVFQALAAPPLEAAPAPVVASHYDWYGLIELMRTVGNDLEAPATGVMPSIAAVKSAVAATQGCEIAVLSGAGPTIVGLYWSAAAAGEAERHLRQAHPEWWVRAGTTGASLRGMP